jgi:hypothetical protein
MSLFESASLVVTPNGTKASKLYAIKPTSGAGDLSVTRATTATRVNSAGLIESVASNVPRLDYLNSTCPSILVEPQRTNNFLYSEQFDNAYWLKSSATITANNTISPDGNTTADKVEFNSGFINGTAIVADNQTYTISFFAKKGTANVIQISEAFYFGTGVVFDLNTGAITSGTGKIENYGNGWYRCSMQITYGVGQAISSWVLRNYQTGYVYLWGIQLEAGSYATSYIPTTTAAVTRNADVISKTSVSSLIGQTEGTIYAEIKVSKLLGTASRYIFHLSDGTANNRIYMAFSGASSNVLRARMFNGGTLQCSIDSSTITTTGTYKLAMAYKNNDIVFYINGVQIGTDTSATIQTCSRVDLGHNYAGASQFNDSINNASVWKTRLSNSELATLTTL